MTKICLGDEIEALINTFGIREVLRALCVATNERGMKTLFNKLNRVYE